MLVSSAVVVVAFLVGVVVTAVASKISNVAFGCGLVVWICPIGDVGFGMWIAVNCVKVDELADKEKTEELGDDELLKW